MTDRPGVGYRERTDCSPPSRADRVVDPMARRASLSAEHEQDHEHQDVRDHAHGRGRRLAFVRSLFRAHSHDAANSVDANLEASADGIRAVRISLLVLAATALLQFAVVLPSRSVALFGDVLHNLADALTALPLWLAFSLSRRRPTRRYTYGYGRAEDLAGVFVVGMIAATSVLVAVAAIERLRHPVTVQHLPLVMAAAVVGMLGNELVAVYRIRIGRRIGSAALVADGLHARTDGLTSLAVLVGAVGVAFGLDWADPVVALFISGAILLVLLQAWRQVWARLMDAVDPSLVGQVEGVLRQVAGVVEVTEVRIRWIGHSLHAQARITVDRDLGIVEAHGIAEDAHHRMLHDIPRLRSAVVHADPSAHAEATDPHEATAHHFGGGSKE
ncbi:MAG: cation diffusion facilitator family transporter [Actinomycetota bacterium]|nr:cation diffusion facilitator family transporter [Actinomycetota bacterium]